MVLRDDEPELYYYAEGRWQPDRPSASYTTEYRESIQLYGSR